MMKHMTTHSQKIQHNQIDAVYVKDILSFDMKITHEEVKNAIFRSQLNKAVCTDKIPNEGLRNDICIILLFML